MGFENFVTAILSSEVEERRAYERYNVLSLPELHASILGVHGSWQLICVGEGGCGFYGSMKTSIRYLPRRARIQFEWPTAFGRDFVVQARLVYRVEKRLEKHNVRYLGFAFDQKSILEIHPLVDYLREMADEGEISTFLR